MVKNSAEQCKKDSKEKKNKKIHETRLPQNHKRAFLEFHLVATT